MLALFAAALLAAADPTPAPSAAAATAAPAATAQKANANDQVCWKEAIVGTRLEKKFCASRADLEARRRNDQDEWLKGKGGAKSPQ